MKKIIGAALCIAALSGCEQANFHLIEQQYEDALDNGDIVTQLALIDDLYQHDPAFYEQDYQDKQALSGVIKQLMANPKNFAGISDEQLSLVIDFAPSYQPFSFAAMHLAEKRRIVGNMSNARNKVAQIKAGLTAKLAKTPNHIETYPTQVSIDGLAPYFLTSKFGKGFIEQYGQLALNSYQLNAVVTAFTSVHNVHSEQIRLHQHLDKLTPESIDSLPAEIVREQGDIERLLVWLYQQQFKHGWDSAVESNDYLISMLHSRYGRERLDNVWLKMVEPEAKKAVMTAKKTYLSDLDLIAAKIYKVAGDNHQLRNLYKTTVELDSTLLSLLWPPNGLDNFKQSSSDAKATLANSYVAIRQL